MQNEYVMHVSTRAKEAKEAKFKLLFEQGLTSAPLKFGDAAKQQASVAARKLERWNTPLGLFVKKYGADTIAGKLGVRGRTVRSWVSGIMAGPELAGRLIALATANGVQLTLEDLRNQAVLCGR
jgi:hypothetical protein